MDRPLSISIFIFFTLISTSLSAETHGRYISAKTGQYTINDTEQEMSYTHGEPSISCIFVICFDSYQKSTASISVEKHSDLGLGFEFELYDSSSGMIFSVETLTFKNAYTSSNEPGATGTIETHLLSANIKRYFNQDGLFQPFVGVGYGQATVMFSGPLNGSLTGEFANVRVGGLYAYKKFDLFMEYLHINGTNVGGGGAGSNNMVISEYNIDGYAVLLGIRKGF